MNKENLAKFYDKYKLYIFPLVVALSSLFLIVFAIFPQTSTLFRNQKIQGDLLNRSEFLETKAAELLSYDERDLSKKVEYVLSAYPSDKDFGNSVGLLQTLSTQSGFDIVAITLGGGGLSKAGGVQSYTVKLEVTGPKGLLSALIKNIESSPRLMRISSLEASGRANEVVDATLSVDVLFSPTPATFGSVDSPVPEISKKDEELLTKLARSTAPILTEEIINVPRGKSNPFQ